MQTLEEDLQYVLDLLHKLAFASLTPANINQLRDATQCVTDIRDASSIAQEIVWILEDNPDLDSFQVRLNKNCAQIKDLKFAPGAQRDVQLCDVLTDRLSNVVRLCSQPDRVNGWAMQGDREALVSHLDARKFDAAAILAIVAPEWSEQLIERIDIATSHNRMVHQSRQGLRERP